MKHLYIILLLLTALLTARAQQAQPGINISGAGNTAYKELDDIGPLYAIQSPSPHGSIIFTPGGDAWHFSWTYEGTLQPVTPYDDSTRYAFPNRGDGHYTLTATRPDGTREERAFIITHIDFSFETELANELDCRYIDIRLKYTELPTYGALSKTEGVEYWVNWGGKDRGPFDGQYALAIDLSRQISQPVAGEHHDVSYSVRIIDRFGFMWESPIGIYTSVIPKAELELKLGNTVDVVGEVHGEMGQAPLEVAYHNNSDNAHRYEWLLYRDTVEMTAPALVWTDSLIGGQVIETFEPPLYTYAHPGHYKVLLIAENETSKCRDTSDAAYVHVVESLLEVPNVFTPNGDGKNDIFMVRALSIQSFHGVILNRWGRQIYEWHDHTAGWDGHIHGKLANPGTYYYVITARGRERVSPPRYIKKGALMLIR